MAQDRCDLLCLDAPAAERIRAALPNAETVTALAAVAQSFADPTRLSILLALDSPQELCVCDLTWIVGKSQNLVSHHLRKLRDAGMVEPRREAKIVFYTLSLVGQQTLAALTSIRALA
ncbi:MAG: transcriptional regulator [Thermoleophilia bacterium]|nr:transcriptional regulator [Thermoleophilia bacterium]